MGADIKHRADGGFLRTVSGVVPAFPDAKNRTNGTEGLYYRLLLSRGMGAIVRYLAYDPDVQGSRRRWRCGRWHRAKPRQFFRHGRRQQ